MVTNTFSLSFWINHLSLVCWREIYTRNKVSQSSRPWLTVRLWSECLLLLLRVPSVTEWKAQGSLLVRLSFVRQFYTVFSSSLQKLQASSGLTKDTAEWRKWPILIFYDCLVAVPPCTGGQQPLDKLYSVADQYSTMGLKRLIDS